MIDLTQDLSFSTGPSKSCANRVAPTATASSCATEFGKRFGGAKLCRETSVRLSAGDLVPADSATRWTARDFVHVLQASLTGESMPAEKEATADPASTKADARNMVFQGTSVVKRHCDR